MTDSRRIVYCCMGCHWRGTIMEMIGADTMRCPKCFDAYMEPANGDAVVVGEWHGEKPSSVN